MVQSALGNSRRWQRRDKNMKSSSVQFSCSILSDSSWPHGLYPARLLYPWGFSRQEYWSGLPCPPPRDLPNPGVEPRSPALQADSLLSELPVCRRKKKVIGSSNTGARTENRQKLRGLSQPARGQEYKNLKWKWNLLSHAQLFATPSTIQSMQFSRPENWSG